MSINLYAYICIVPMYARLDALACNFLSVYIQLKLQVILFSSFKVSLLFYESVDRNLTYHSIASHRPSLFVLLHVGPTKQSCWRQATNCSFVAGNSPIISRCLGMWTTQAHATRALQASCHRTTSPLLLSMSRSMMKTASARFEIAFCPSSLFLFIF